MSSSMSVTAKFTDWKPILGFYDPPAPPKGYKTEVERDCFLGLVISYRYIKSDK
jgi:hypothetical protein